MELQEAGISVSSGRQSHLPQHRGVIESQIRNSELFIGITKSQNTVGSKSQVAYEYRAAKKLNKAAFILMDVSNPMPYQSNQPNPTEISPYNSEDVIYFDRYHPKEAVKSLKARIEKKQNAKTSNAAAWVVGGLALLALIGAFSEDE
ncbi:MAG: hypothetical protein EP346_07055 [Bacteroidetes bacterium]|nr:MAG: hypothetical protein EP346_07055 [Bacteroidota bacterium]